jgi:uncharacterized protein
MTADDLTAPLGQKPKPHRRGLYLPLPPIIAGALALFLGLFVTWAIVADHPFGGEPQVIVPAGLHHATTAETSGSTSLGVAATSHGAPAGKDGKGGKDGATPVQVPTSAAAAANMRTITIIDGKTGARQEVLIPAPQSDTALTGSIPSTAKTDDRGRKTEDR